MLSLAPLAASAFAPTVVRSPSAVRASTVKMETISDLKVLADKLVLRKYTPVKGDQIDELFALSLNATKFSETPVVRLSKIKYKFGEREFRANVKNNKLIIQVGGGFMSVDEYIN